MELQQKRVFGLDVVRSVAIILVLLAHGFDFFLIPVLKESFFGRVIIKSLNYPMGFFGVELFFVLSGFLIGKIIIKELVENGEWKNLFIFYIRRWFRTLPLYFLVILILICFPIGPFSLSNLFFVQNFSSDTLAFNPVSWSLSVEEWFYLLFPLITIVVFQFIKADKGKSFIGICLVLMILSLLARIMLVLFNDPSFDFGTRKQIFFRLDSIIAGVILAGIKFYYKDTYRKLIEERKMLFIMSVVGFFLCEMWFIAHRNIGMLDNSFFSRTFFFNVVTLCCSLFVLSLENIRTPKIKFIGKAITFISLMSYGLYLLHFRIYIFLKSSIPINSIFIAVTLLVTAIVITLILSAVIYKYYELPMMQLRDKFSVSKSKHSKTDKVYIAN